MLPIGGLGDAACAALQAAKYAPNRARAVKLVSYEEAKGMAESGRAAIIEARAPGSRPQPGLRGAVPVPLEQIIAPGPHGEHLAASPEDAARAFGAAGVGQDTVAVVAGQYGEPFASRMAWTLEYIGHKNTALLSESLALLKRQGAPFEDGGPAPAPAQLEPHVNGSVRAQMADVQAALGAAIMLDARSPQEYMQGHIPGAASVPYSLGMSRDGRHIAPRAELEKTFASVPKDGDIICYCTHGHRASALFCQLKAAGYEAVRVYDGSVTEWAASRLRLE